MAKIKVKVKVVPATGSISDTTHSVTVEPTKATLGEVLKAAGVKPKKQKFEVNGKSAELDTLVDDGAEIVVTEAAAGS